MTKYHVLRLRPAGSPGSNEVWEIVARDVEANDDKAAIRKALTDLSEKRPAAVLGSGTPTPPEPEQAAYVATPARSWKPRRGAPETKTTFKLF